MHINTMCRVFSKHHGMLFAAKNNRDTMCFSKFDDAYAYVTNVIDEETLGPIDVIQVWGAPPGNQVQATYSPEEKDAIRTDLESREPFE